MKTYKTTAEDLPVINKQFLLALSGYNDGEIKKAFRIYRDENTDMPTTACIRRIILGNQKHARKSEHNKQIEKRNNPKYSELPDELKLEIDDALLEIRANLAPDSVPKNITAPD